jgi:hypothetical protein
MTSPLKQITIKIKTTRCDYCGKLVNTTRRSFQDGDGSSVDSNVCYPCQVNMGIESHPRCSECGRKLIFNENERFWGCLEHGRKDVNEFPDSRLFKYVKEK